MSIFGENGNGGQVKTYAFTAQSITLHLVGDVLNSNYVKLVANEAKRNQVKFIVVTCKPSCEDCQVSFDYLGDAWEYFNAQVQSM
jgi:hypothetical protein